MAEEVFNVLIVRLKKKVSVQAPFRHRYRFKSTGIGKNPNDTHPYSWQRLPYKVPPAHQDLN